MPIRKILFFGLTILVFIILPLNSLAAVEILDQQCSCGSINGDALNDGTKFPMYQVFQPSLNHLTKISLNFSNGASADITLTVKDMSGNQIGIATRSVDVGWYDFVFGSALVLNTGLNYQIHLSNSPTANSRWFFCQPGGYSRGYAVTSGTVIPDKDYMFKSYGYNESATPSPNSSTISPPENLKAEDVPDDEGGKILLSWNKSSTANLDGYRLYRKTKDEHDFQRVGEVKSNKLEYEDAGLENGRLYIYVARAYKGESESADSNEARATPENNLAPKTPTGLRVIAKGVDYLEVSWDKVDDEKLDLYIILYGDNQNNLSLQKEISADRTVYRAEGLKPGTRYYFKIASKSKDGQTSGFSEIISDSTLSTKKSLSWVWILSIIILVLGAAGLYLYLAHLKKWWPFKKKTLKLEPTKPKLDKNPDRDIDNDIKELPGKKGKW